MKICLLGASGSIGKQTIDVINKFPKDFSLAAFSVGKRTRCISYIIRKHPKVKHICIQDKTIANKYKKKYPNITFYSEEKGLLELIRNSDSEMVVNALVGFVGLLPSIEAIKCHKKLALANKESLVVGGDLINSLLKEYNGELYPIDSEHSALWKCLKVDSHDVNKLILTASGGSFRKLSRKELENVTPEDALKHPTWKMGNKITIDCATMMNKGFEVIEAWYLYHYPLDQVEIKMHDESLVHSMVELKDGSLLVDYGKPDMRNPIAWAMMEGDLEYDILHIKSLDELKDCHFHDYDPKRYPCTELAKKALITSSSKMIALNAANEVAVNRFLKDEIKFTDIEKIVKRVVDSTPVIYKPNLRTIKRIDKISRKKAA